MMSLKANAPVVGTRIVDLDTPCLLLDLDKVERNMDVMARAFTGTSVGIRPHAKTHKSARIARMQLERGAVGICCAKLGEAEVLAGHGISGILITSELAGQPKIQRLLGLARTASVITVVDDAAAARQISDAAVAAGLRIDCLLDIDVGTNRTGVAAGEPALALGLEVAHMLGLNLIGVQGYEGHLQHIVSVEERRAHNSAAMRPLCQTADALRDQGLPIQIVSTAGTGTCAFAAQWEGVTEVQPGSYICMDTDYGAVDGLHFEYALTVLSSVISKRNNGVTVDAGFKTLSTDAGPARPKDLEASYKPRGDEHGLLTFESGNPLSIGDKVTLIPSHCDTTINLHDVYHVTRGDTVVGVWPIAARGRLQ
jgi:D-serine deaminase-like pyridoxal phosphate-dependent protein